jgi:hypothetical protein
MRSKPIADRAHYPSKSELINVVDERRETLVKCCANLSDAQWQTANPIDGLRQPLPTVWHVMHFLMLTHESTHLGQLACWRRAQGLPMALSKVGEG